MKMNYLLAFVLVVFCAEQGTGKYIGRVIEDPCDHFYCANGGVCILNDHIDRHSGMDRSSGEESHSIEHRDSDEDRHSGPTCQCTGDWTGDRCDDSPCQNVNCNSGTCYFDANGSPHCCCPAGTPGKFCEIIDPCDHFYCANGGVCILNDHIDRHSGMGRKSGEESYSIEHRDSDEDRHSGPTCQCTGNWKGDRCDDSPCQNVNCNTGACHSDDNGSPHCCCPAGTSGEFCEFLVICSQLASPSNGEVSVKDTTVGSSATYSCDTNNNFALCIHEILTCGNDGEWDKEPPVCIKELLWDASYTVSYGNSTYYFSNKKENTVIAQAVCDDRGGNLLSINSDEEWEFIKCDIKIIGLIKNDGQWGWTSNQPVTATYWSPAPTDSDICTVIEGRNWKSRNSTFCDLFGGRFICENNNA